MKKFHLAVLLLAVLACTSARAFAGDTHGGGPTSGKVNGPLSAQAISTSSGTAGADASRRYYGFGMPALSEDSDPFDGSYSYDRRKDPSTLPFLKTRVLTLALYFMLFGDSLVF